MGAQKFFIAAIGWLFFLMSHVAVASLNENEFVNTVMPGRLQQYHVIPGQEFDVGDALFTLEAMKMETIVRASKPGVMRSILVPAGDIVRPSQPLFYYASIDEEREVLDPSTITMGDGNEPPSSSFNDGLSIPPGSDSSFLTFTREVALSTERESAFLHSVQETIKQISLLVFSKESSFLFSKHYTILETAENDAQYSQSFSLFLKEGESMLSSVTTHSGGGEELPQSSSGDDVVWEDSPLFRGYFFESEPFLVSWTLKAPINVGGLSKSLAHLGLISSEFVFKSTSFSQGVSLLTKISHLLNQEEDLLRQTSSITTHKVPQKIEEDVLFSDVQRYVRKVWDVLLSPEIGLVCSLILILNSIPSFFQDVLVLFRQKFFYPYKTLAFLKV